MGHYLAYKLGALESNISFYAISSFHECGPCDKSHDQIHLKLDHFLLQGL